MLICVVDHRLMLTSVAEYVLMLTYVVDQLLMLRMSDVGHILVLKSHHQPWWHRHPIRPKIVAEHGASADLSECQKSSSWSINYVLMSFFS